MWVRAVGRWGGSNWEERRKRKLPKERKIKKEKRENTYTKSGRNKRRA